MSLPKVISHRGNGTGLPENSIPAFEAALVTGVHGVEMDVRSTADGVAVLMHDETVNRTTDGRGRVSDMFMEDLARLVLRDGGKVPTLEAALAALKGRCHIMIEMKDAGSASATRDVLIELDMWDRVTVSSFSGPWLVDLKLRHPGARVAFVCDDRKLEPLRIAGSIKAHAVHLGRRIATRATIEQAHADGLEVCVWAVNTPRQARRYADWGADGIITDRPGKIADFMK